MFFRPRRGRMLVFMLDLSNMRPLRGRKTGDISISTKIWPLRGHFNPLFAYHIGVNPERLKAQFDIMNFYHMINGVWRAGGVHFISSSSKPLCAQAHAVREANPIGAAGFGAAESAFVLMGQYNEMYRKIPSKQRASRGNRYGAPC